jgi:RNA polymerase sigma-70 factor (ECF subfamily)
VARGVARGVARDVDGGRGADGDADDATLVLALRAGAASALVPLLARHSPPLYRLAHRLTGDEAVAEDLVQEAWLRLIRRPPRLAPGQSALPWLRRVLARLAVDEARRAARRPATSAGLAPGDDGVDPAPGPDALAVANADRRRLRRALGRLPPVERAILVLLHGEGWSVREVAAALGLTATVVKNRAFRARRALRQRLMAEGWGVADDARGAERVHAAGAAVGRTGDGRGEPRPV